MALTNKLTNIANAIRTKTGTSGTMTLDQMATAITNIPTGSTDVPFAYGGMNAELIDIYSTQFTLADTSFVIGTSASTSSTSIKASVSNMYTTPTSPTVAYGDKDIVVVQSCLTKPTHGSTATNKAMQLATGYQYVSYFSKRKTTDTSGTTYRQSYNLVGYMMKYYNTSGAITRTATTSYGFYQTPTAPTVASTSAASTYVRCSSPTLYYRANSSYESTTNIKLVTDCTFDWKVEVYTVDAFSSPVAKMNEVIDDLIVNGL